MAVFFLCKSNVNNLISFPSHLELTLSWPTSVASIVFVLFVIGVQEGLGFALVDWDDGWLAVSCGSLRLVPLGWDR